MKQLLAFVAATVIVFTAIYVFLLWRNQSANRVLNTAAGHIIYQTSDVAIGVQPRTNGPNKVTLLKFSMEGGWSSAGTSQWFTNPQSTKYADITLIQNLSSGSPDSYWLCAAQKNAKLTSIELYHASSPRQSETLEFHHGGIIEPVMVPSNTIIRGFIDKQMVFSYALQGPASK